MTSHHGPTTPLPDVAARANAQFYDTLTDATYADGAPHLKHQSLREYYLQLVHTIYERVSDRPTVRVYDIGAGEGSVTLPFLALGASVTAVDVSARQLENLRMRCAAHADRLDTQCGDVAVAIQSARDAGIQYDVIVANSFLHHLPDYQGLIRSVLPLLAPGGVFFCFQDPLPYKSLGQFTRVFGGLGYMTWRIGQADVFGGLARRIRRLRGKYHEDLPEDNEEYHVIRGGVDATSIARMLRALDCEPELITYFSSQSRWAQRIGEFLELRNTFAIIAVKGHITLPPSQSDSAMRQSLKRGLTVLVPVDFYLPGYRGGGALRTVVNMVAALPDHFRFRVVTRDRDLGGQEPYPGCQVGTWQPVGQAEVFYLPPPTLSVLLSLRRILRETEYDLLYLNSFFSPAFTIWPLLLRRLGQIPKTPVILAPRGEFSPGAIALKRDKKQRYIRFARRALLYRDVTFQASTGDEATEIAHALDRSSDRSRLSITVAQDIATAVPKESGILKSTPSPAEAGVLRIVFLSRICPKKNLDGALEILRGVKANVEFDIYGPIEDTSYWDECQRLISALPAHIVASYCGPVEHAATPSLFRNYHLFLLPTHGENYGHVIIEALLAGCPVLISDKTPWRDLATYRAGWEFPLENVVDFHRTLEFCASLSVDDFASYRNGALQLGQTVLDTPGVIDQNARLFESVMCQARGEL